MSTVSDVAVALIGVGIVLWVWGRYQQKISQNQVIPMPSQIPFDEEKLSVLVSSHPDLPALPNSSLEYDGWFEEVKKRARMRSSGRTQIEGLALLKRVSEYHEEWIKIIQTRKAILKETGQDPKAKELEDLEHKAKVAKLQLEIAASEQQIQKLKETSGSPKVLEPRDPTEERRVWIRNKVRNIRTLRKDCEDLIKEEGLTGEDAACARREYTKFVADLRERS
jgi:hypothetical protein